ncbi:hypothetical protein EYF80_045490 [Liparis tanakae]|uniref:Uncharacterized protein n=1 Tax=Liparis tanakae TaxID=230148 RepID=A0A4Z2FSX4_9TELE|nr:hypothetical protein EYF80_045490 [Liparis tanakae]
MEFHSAHTWSRLAGRPGAPTEMNQRHRATANRDVGIVLSPSPPPSHLLARPLSGCLAADYQCNTSNKIHQPNTFPPSNSHFIYKGSANPKTASNLGEEEEEKEETSVPRCEQRAQEPRGGGEDLWVGGRVNAIFISQTLP